VAKFLIEAVPERCTGCLRCQLSCSQQYTKAFNPSAARIRIVLKGAGCEVSFSAECTGCGICVENCFYDALLKRPGKVKS
jgi:anaerobic carbon-monoxide dehydrogenase iron sulfur subunit